MKQTDVTGPIERTGRIDWDAIYRRLERVQQVLEQKQTPPAEMINQTLAARAAMLAREPDGEPIHGESLDVIEFVLAHETYAIESRFVSEIYPLKEFTPLPGVPSFVLGIVNVHGQILSIVDIKKFFDLPEKGLTDLNKLLILDSGPMRFGILADAVTGMKSILAEELQGSLPALAGLRQAFFKGITGEGLIVLDGEKLLTHEDIIVNQVSTS